MLAKRMFGYRRAGGILNQSFSSKGPVSDELATQELFSDTFDRANAVNDLGANWVIDRSIGTGGTSIRPNINTNQLYWDHTPPDTNSPANGCVVTATPPAASLSGKHQYSKIVISNWTLSVDVNIYNGPVALWTGLLTASTAHGYFFRWVKDGSASDLYLLRIRPGNTVEVLAGPVSQAVALGDNLIVGVLPAALSNKVRCYHNGAQKIEYIDTHANRAPVTGKTGIWTQFLRFWNDASYDRIYNNNFSTGLGWGI